MMKNAALALVLLLCLGSAAQAAEWIVERATRNVSVSADGTNWTKIAAGDAVPNAYWVRTGPLGRVIFAKGSERILFRPNTLAAISTSQPTGQRTKVTQQRGSVLLAVQKKQSQHTSVVTPHIAAVVKGTVFEVTVRRGQTQVRVDDGRVEVANENGRTEIAPGEVAAASAGSSIAVETANVTSLSSTGQIVATPVPTAAALESGVFSTSAARTGTEKDGQDYSRAETRLSAQIPSVGRNSQDSGESDDDSTESATSDSSNSSGSDTASSSANPDAATSSSAASDLTAQTGASNTPASGSTTPGSTAQTHRATPQNSNSGNGLGRPSDDIIPLTGDQFTITRFRGRSEEALDPSRNINRNQSD